MKVFLSSLIAGFEDERWAAKRGIETLRHEAIMAEDFAATPNSPQVACLTGLRQADLVVLILGERYGAIQPSSGLSATHEEYKAAKGTKPIIAFVQQPGEFEAAQSDFIAEVQGWEAGLFRGGYASPEELNQQVVRALHEYQMANAAGSADPVQLRTEAMGLLKVERDNYYRTNALLQIAIVGGPIQQIIRPAELESGEFQRKIHQFSAFGEHPFIDAQAATKGGLDGDAFALYQDSGASIKLTESGAMRLVCALDAQSDRRVGYMDGSVLIEERVSSAIQSSLAFGGWLLDMIDPTQRLTHVGIAANIVGAQHRAWRTQAEHNAQPNSVSMGFLQSDQDEPIVIDRPRAAIKMGRPNLTEDLMVALRRRWPRGG